MPEFKYIARDSSGKTVTGQQSASSSSALVTELDRKSLTVISVEKVTAEKKAATGKPSFFSLSFGKREGKVRTDELVALCKQLSTMLHGGVPILNAIRSIGDESKNLKLKRVLGNVADDLRDGKRFSESLGKYPDVFSDLFIAIVESGEKVGSLDKMLLRLSEYLERSAKLAGKIKSAMTYPIFIAGFFLIAVAGVTLFLVPRFQKIYAGFGAKLPPLTQVIFDISNFVVQNIILVIIVTVVSTVSLVYFVKKTRKGRVLYDKMLLRLPMFGDFIMKAAISKFCRTLATLLEQGISINEALLLVGRTCGNVVIEEASQKAGQFITEGQNITDAFSKVGVFPSLMLQMTSVGVDSGSLPELLDNTANFYEDQVDNFISALTTMIEPILIVSLGGLVGVVVIALYLPILQLSSAMSGH
ncbi:type II secretion system F family protein [Candidatus Omnitrophota bacterium]